MLKQLWHSVLMVALLAAICISFSAAQAAQGDLDPTFAGFAGDGVANLPVSVNDIAVQPDGKVVVVGSSSGNPLTVARLLPDGRLDFTFDHDGIAAFPDTFTPVSVALQADGRIVVGGARNGGFSLARLTPAGALDSSFGGGYGWLSDVDPQVRELKSILVQPDGKIVACGANYFSDDDIDFAVTRYNLNGARDPAFGGGDGKVTIPFGEEDRCTDVAQQPGDKLVVAGTRFDPGFHDGEYDDFVVARLEADGALDDNSDGDGGFDGDGKLTTSLGGDEFATAVSVQPDGKIIVLGHRESISSGHVPSLLARYLPNGALDGSFGSGGKLSIPADHLSELAVGPDGTLVLAGYHTSPDGDKKLAVRRLLPNGNPDTTFDGDGVAWFDFGGRDEASTVAVLPDGRILAGGFADPGKVLLRLWPDGTLDTGGKQTHAVNAEPIFPLGSDVTFATVAVLPGSGGLVVAGEVEAPATGRAGAFLTRFNADGQPDAAFGVQGGRLVTEGMRSGARAVAVQPDGKIVIAGYSDWGDNVWPSDFMVTRYRPDGSPDTGFGDINSRVYVNFAGGSDVGTALALAPDGKIVVAGWAWTGTRQVWGVARLNPDGSPDSSFDQDGKAFIDLGPGSTAHAVLVQPDGKILVGGKTPADNFALARLTENGQPDLSFGTAGGSIITDMGGTDNIAALALGADGMIYAGGYSQRGGQDDYALAQYTPTGQLATCPAGQTCNYWPSGKRFVNIGGSDSIFALALRADGQLLAAGCTDGHMSAAQVSTTDANAAPLVFETSFAGHLNCAFSVQFTGTNNSRIIAAGPTYHGTNGNIALARFETTVNNPEPTPTPTSTTPTPPTTSTPTSTTPTPPTTPSATPPPPSNVHPVYLPLIVR